MALAYSLPKLTEEYHLMWIDAICINQEDFHERAEQVNLMRKIYKSSQCLTIWLGCETSTSNMGFAVLKRLKEAAADPGSLRGLKPGHSFDASKGEYFALRRIFESDYFMRSWVLQEYSLGSLSASQQDYSQVDRIIFCCGSQQISNLIELGQMGVVQQQYNWHHRDEKSRRAEIRQILQRFWLLRSSSQHQTQICNMLNKTDISDDERLKVPSLLSLLWMCSGNKATDPRDKIYSLLGLTEELGLDGIPVGYSPQDLIVGE